MVAALLVTSISLALLSAATVGLVLLGSAGAVIGLYFQLQETRSSLIQVTPQTSPLVFNLGKTAAHRLRMPEVEIFVRQDANLNAYASGLGGASWVVINSATADVLTPAELLFVIGHELGHIRKNHVMWQVLIGRSGHAIPVVSAVLRVVFSGWSQEAEITADRAGFRAAGELESCVSALLKICSGTSMAESGHEIEKIDRARTTADDLNEAIAELQLTHPPLARRIRALESFARSTGDA